MHVNRVKLINGFKEIPSGSDFFMCLGCEFRLGYRVESCQNYDLFFCSGLQVRVLTYTDSRYSQHLGDIRKLFINAIGHSYLPLYESELKIGDSAIRLTEKKIDD